MSMSSLAQMNCVLLMVVLWIVHSAESSVIPRNRTGDVENLAPKLETKPQFPLPSNQTNPTTIPNENFTGDDNLAPKQETKPQSPLPSNQTNPTTSTIPNDRFSGLMFRNLTSEAPTSATITESVYTPITHEPPSLDFKLKYQEYVEPGRNVSALLETVLNKYDKRIRPFYGVRPLDVNIDILILSFGELEEASMEYSVDMYLGQFWQDPRLAFGLDRVIILGGEACEKLWVPDTFFVNSIESKIQTMMFVNKKVWISLKNGTMMLSARMVSRNSCKFDLRNYPLDEQTCHLAFESFSYSETDLLYKWRNKSVGSDIHVYDREMAQFDIIEAKRYLKHKVYHSDFFSGLTATIVFKRRAAYYIFQMYIPCVCITALSWVSFWIHHEAVPARVGLSITTVLTISYMRGSVNANMPRVSYLKSIDYFLLVSFVFIFLTLIEYVLVLSYSRKDKFKKSNDVDLKANDSYGGDMEKEPMLVTVSVGSTSYNYTTALDTVENGDGIALKERSRKPPLLMRTNNPISYRGKQNGCSVNEKSYIPSPRKSVSSCNSQAGCHWLDVYSRYIFTALYILFLVVYFVYYTNTSKYSGN